MKNRENKELVTVIVPVYNTEKFLEQCLESIRAQTYDNLEIILVDDGSTDKSGNICDKYAKIDERFVVYHTENKGVSSARNLGIQKASGSYIGFVDCDDWISEGMYEYLYSISEMYDADISMCGVSYVSEQGVALQSRVNCFDDEKIILSAKNILKHHLLSYKSPYRINVGVWNKLYKREVLLKIPFPIGKKYEDMFWTYKILGQCSTLVFSNKFHYFYRQRTGSICNSGFSYRYFDNLFANIERYNYINANFVELNGLVTRRFVVDCIEILKIINEQTNVNDYIKAKRIIRQLILKVIRDRYIYIWCSIMHLKRKQLQLSELSESDIL